jgi:hypothetical protein
MNAVVKSDDGLKVVLEAVAECMEESVDDLRQMIMADVVTPMMKRIVELEAEVARLKKEVDSHDVFRT